MLYQTGKTVCVGGNQGIRGSYTAGTLERARRLAVNDIRLHRKSGGQVELNLPGRVWILRGVSGPAILSIEPVIGS